MKKLSLLLLLAASLGACKKNDDNAPSRADLLTAKNWRVSADTYTKVDNGKTTTVDEYAKSLACERDNFLKFNTNKSLITDEGATKCSASDPQMQTSNWDFSGDQTKLNYSFSPQSSFVLSSDIVELSATTLRLRATNTNGTTTETEDITYTAF